MRLWVCDEILQSLRSFRMTDWGWSAGGIVFGAPGWLCDEILQSLRSFRMTKLEGAMRSRFFRGSNEGYVVFKVQDRAAGTRAGTLL